MVQPLCQACGHACRKYYKLSTLSDMFEISEKTLRRMIADRRIRAVRIGGSVRIPHAELGKIVQEY